MQDNVLESGEYYRRRYNRACPIIVIPIFLLLITLIILGGYLKTDITTTGSGVITSNMQQAPSEVTGTISENNIASINKNQPIKFTMKGNQGPASGLKGKVTQIGNTPKIINDQTYYQVKVKLTDNKHNLAKLKPGMTGKVSIITDQQTYLQYLKENM